MIIMKCNACGAPLEAGQEKCTYCGTLTPYGEEKFKQREAQKIEAERQQRLDSLPAMKFVPASATVLLYIFTGTFYSPYWYAVRMKSLNSLGTKAKLQAWAVGVFAVLMFATFMLPSYDLTASGISEELSENIYNTVLSLLILVSGWLAYSVKNILQEHAAQFIGKTNAVQSIANSNLMLILFGPAYLQLQVNKMIKMNMFAPKI